RADPARGQRPPRTAQDGTGTVHGPRRKEGDGRVDDAAPASVTPGVPPLAAPAQPPAPRSRRVRSALTVALVLALSGLMFTANARLARGDDSRHPENLAQLLDREPDRVADLAEQDDALTAEGARLPRTAHAP